MKKALVLLMISTTPALAWKESVSIDTMTDQPIARIATFNFGATRSDFIALEIQCRRGDVEELDFRVSGFPLSDNKAMTVRVDSNKSADFPVEYAASAFEGLAMIQTKGKPVMSILKQLESARQQVKVRHGEQTVSFPVDGISSAVKTLKRTCDL
jgi:hypothetical protein